MKTVFILLTLFLVAFALDKNDFYTLEVVLKEDLSDVFKAEVEDDQKWLVPQFDGSFEWMTEQEAKDRTIKTEIIEEIKWARENFKYNKRKKVQFFLYTQKNPVKWQELDIDSPETLERSHFNASHPTRIFSHGWLGGAKSGQTVEIVDSHLSNGRKENYNMIVVDWSCWAMTANYYLARLRTRRAGKRTAELIDWLHEKTGMPFETTYVYGHSLGAHVAGFTGKQVTKGKIKTIIGLDSAMPLFRLKNPQNRLADTDAEYVESMHTNGQVLGFYNPIGHAAFYPNGGRSQPTCGFSPFDCAHGRAITYLAEAIARGVDNGFDTVTCNNFTDVKVRHCEGDSGGIRMADPENYKKARGIYFLKTDGKSPFGIGTDYLKR
ncbi:hypothetical protein ACFFRR_004588 [Megaselia abdita]